MSEDVSNIVPTGDISSRETRESRFSHEVTWASASGTHRVKVNFGSGALESHVPEHYATEIEGGDKKRAITLFLSKNDIDALPGTNTVQKIEIAAHVVQTELQKRALEPEGAEGDVDIVDVYEEVPKQAAAPSEPRRSRSEVQASAKRAAFERARQEQAQRDQRRGEALGLSPAELTAIRSLRSQYLKSPKKYRTLKALRAVAKAERPTRRCVDEDGHRLHVQLACRSGELYAEVRGRLFGAGGIKQVEDVRAWALTEGEDTRYAYAKVLKERREDEEAMASIQSERMAFDAIATHHVRCAAEGHKFTSEKAYAYMAVPYVQGDCRSLMPSEGANTGERLTDVVSVIKDAAAFLADFHKAGLVHGDITPGNFNLDGRDDHGRLHIRVGDFGTVKKPGEHVGPFFTLHYVPKDTKAVSTASPAMDIHMLGICLLVMRYGFRATKHDWDPVVPLYPELKAGADKDPADPLDVLILRMCDTKPEKRPSAQEVEEVLGRILDQRTGDRPSPMGASTGSSSSPHPSTPTPPSPPPLET